ncbi:MAG TPA: aminotransferase class I/II-fold pyridoxal phosphate-dependent enzyme [Chloroflexota bacterium]|nr:aminotransferase class I/II-fold pyridoxal phosphate-dependent enzyme [Chloroflexota bacterium]
MPRISHKAGLFTESAIRDMTRQILQYHGADGVNLAQGFPDFAAPAEIKEAAVQAIRDDHNQYAITWGQQPLRQAIAEKYSRAWGRAIDPEREITVCCGATETMLASIMAIIDPGDEVVCFSPFYENYGPDCILSGATPRFVTLHEPDWTIDSDELKAAFNSRTRGIVINTPHNPTGKVFDRAEMESIAGLCVEHDVVAFTDEIYEHLVYEGEHISIATLPGMAERTVTISGLSKTFSVTGWRLGFAIAPPVLTDAIRKVHDFMTVGAAAPLQLAAAAALHLPAAYYEQLLADYRQRRDFLVGVLGELGFRIYEPHGAYYVMTDIGAFGYASDLDFATYLARDVGVAAVPGSSFYHEPALGRTKIRFAFPKKMETLERAAGLLRKVRPMANAGAGIRVP